MARASHSPCLPHEGSNLRPVVHEVLGRCQSSQYRSRFFSMFLPIHRASISTSGDPHPRRPASCGAENSSDSISGSGAEGLAGVTARADVGRCGGAACSHWNIPRRDRERLPRRADHVGASTKAGSDESGSIPTPCPSCQGATPMAAHCFDLRTSPAPTGRPSDRCRPASGQDPRREEP
jgi:hypothetical protein